MGSPNTTTPGAEQPSLLNGGVLARYRATPVDRSSPDLCEWSLPYGNNREQFCVPRWVTKPRDSFWDRQKDIEQLEATLVAAEQIAGLAPVLGLWRTAEALRHWRNGGTDRTRADELLPFSLEMGNKDYGLLHPADLLWPDHRKKCIFYCTQQIIPLAISELRRNRKIMSRNAVDVLKLSWGPARFNDEGTSPDLNNTFGECRFRSIIHVKYLVDGTIDELSPAGAPRSKPLAIAKIFRWKFSVFDVYNWIKAESRGQKGRWGKTLGQFSLLPVNWTRREPDTTDVSGDSKWREMVWDKHFHHLESGYWGKVLAREFPQETQAVDLLGEGDLRGAGLPLELMLS